MIIPVAKSTLSLWLRDVGLAKAQKQRITEARMAAQRRGADRRREIRLAQISEINQRARKDRKAISTRELHLMALMLYWAEGSKEKEWRRGSGVIFSNSDPRMIKFFIKWLIDCMNVLPQNISCSIYTHDSHRYSIERVKEYWQKIIGPKLPLITQVYFKRNKIMTKRRNTGETYFGLLRIRILKSSVLLREITSMIDVVCDKVC